MKKHGIVIMVIVWAAVIGAAEIVLLNYETRPGLQEKAPEQWPEGTSLQKSAGLPTLLMFVHPRCPCSRASLGELNILMSRCQGKAAVQVLFLKPEKFSDDWTQTENWKEALLIPGAVLKVDAKGTETQRFRAVTSGQILLYGTQGELLFSGGITASRGHSGDNDGRSILEKILLTGTAEKRHLPVFGCPLRNPSGNSLKGFFSLWRQ